MLSHVEMAPAGAGGGFKLFGKVITQCVEGTQASPSPSPAFAAQDEERRLHGEADRTTTAIKREAADMDSSHQHQQQPQQQQPGAEASRRTQLQESAEARAAAAPLPCPRCRSRETKFCYFNNYNVNQPRHFCKACHRYWTAGGAIRNVPVGSGRRKNRPVLHGASTVMSVADHHLAGPASPGMPNGLGFHPDHGWSQAVPSPAYLGHGEMEQCWWLVQQYPAQGQVNGDVQLSPSSLRINQYA